MFGIVAKAVETNPFIKISALEKLIKKEPELYRRYSSDTAMRADIIKIRLKVCNGNNFHNLMQDVKITPEQRYIDMPEKARLFFDKVNFGTRTEKFDMTLGLICQCHQEKRNVILNLPCSSGKSFMSIIYAAYLADQGKRVWIVSEQISSCKQKAKILTKMNVSAIAYHGRDTTVCTAQTKDFYKNTKPCKNCSNKCGAELKYLNKSPNKFDYPHANVVCCTHSNYISALSNNDLPENLELVIIDESPNVLESISLNEDKLKLLKKIARCQNDYDAGVLLDFINDITRYKDGGSHKMPSLDKDIADNVLKIALTRLRSGKLNEESMDAIYSFLTFFQNDKIYGMCTIDDNDQSNFNYITGHVDLKCKTQTIILDGSAKNQITRWENFEIVSCDKLYVSYPNTTLHLIKANPSKTKILEEAIQNKIKKIATKQLQSNDNVIIFSNKKPLPPVKQLEQIAQKAGANHLIMQRGEHIGSNKGKHCNKAIIASMSLFTTIADYVLKASIVKDKEIPEKEIFDIYRDKRYPAYDKNGFRNKDIDEQYILSIERDLYQAIMRGCIREDNTNTYDVVATINSNCVLAHLMHDLPEVKIKLEDDIVTELFLAGYSISEIQQMTQKPQSTVSSAVQRMSELLGIKRKKCADKDLPDAA